MIEHTEYQKYVNHEKIIEAMQKVKKLHARAIAEGRSYEDIKKEHCDGKCPLCEVCVEYQESHELGEEQICNVCPWVAFNFDNCEKFGYSNSVHRIGTLDKWIKWYEEDAKREPKKKKFKPFQIMLDIDSEEKLNVLMAIINAGSNNFENFYKHVYFSGLPTLDTMVATKTKDEMFPSWETAKMLCKTACGKGK